MMKKIKDLKNDNDQLTTYLKQEEKRINDEILEINEKKENLQSQIDKKYEIQETILKESLDNKKKSLKGLESAVAPSDEVNVIQNEITEINQEIEEMQKKKDDLNQSVAQLDKEIEKKNEAITDIKKELKTKSQIINRQ